MKKSGLLLAFLAMCFFNVSAQFDAGMLDKAMSMLNSGKQTEVAGIMKNVVDGLGVEAKSSKNEFGPKILSQLSGVSALIPALTKGNANVSAVQKIINTIKMLVAAQRLKGLVSGGSLLGKASQLTSNVGLLKSGMSVLGENSSIGKITKALDLVTKKSSKLSGSGLGAKFAQKAIGKKLNSSLGLLAGMI